MNKQNVSCLRIQTLALTDSYNETENRFFVTENIALWMYRNLHTKPSSVPTFLPACTPEPIGVTPYHQPHNSIWKVTYRKCFLRSRIIQPSAVTPFCMGWKPYVRIYTVTSRHKGGAMWRSEYSAPIWCVSRWLTWRRTRSCNWMLPISSASSPCCSTMFVT
jgi:hypothetical protein